MKCLAVYHISPIVCETVWETSEAAFIDACNCQGAITSKHPILSVRGHSCWLEWIDALWTSLAWKGLLHIVSCHFVMYQNAVWLIIRHFVCKAIPTVSDRPWNNTYWWQGGMLLYICSVLLLFFRFIYVDTFTWGLWIGNIFWTDVVAQLPYGSLAKTYNGEEALEKKKNQKKIRN